MRLILLLEFLGRKWGISPICGVNDPPELSTNYVIAEPINNDHTDNTILPLDDNYSNYSQDII